METGGYRNPENYKPTLSADSVGRYRNPAKRPEYADLAASDSIHAMSRNPERAPIATVSGAGYAYEVRYDFAENYTVWAVASDEANNDDGLAGKAFYLGRVGPNGIDMGARVHAVLTCARLAEADIRYNPYGRGPRR